MAELRKRIFHIIPELNVGGTEKQLLLVLPELPDTYIHEVVCLMGHGAIGDALEKRGVKVHYLNGTGNSDLRIPFKLWSLLRRKKPAAIVTYLIYADIVGRIAAPLAGIRTVIESHRSHLFGPAWWHMVDKYTRRLVSHYTCQTNATKQLLHNKLSIPRDSITAIPNAVVLASHGPVSVRSDLGIAQEDIVITSVANLKPEKDLGVLLEAFEDAYTSNPNAHVLLVGDGPERSKLEKQILSYQSKHHIHFLGLRDDVKSILYDSDIFVLPTRIEGMSNAILEACAAGLPCVTTNIPTIKDLIIDGKTGFLISPGDVTQLASFLKQLVRDTGMRQSVGSAAKDYVEQHHSVEAISSAWNSLFKVLI